jgi:hypothetical protein
MALAAFASPPPSRAPSPGKQPKHEAISWAVRRIRWERRLDDLRAADAPKPLKRVPAAES